MTSRSREDRVLRELIGQSSLGNHTHAHNTLTGIGPNDHREGGTWWMGHGSPGIIVGSEIGDFYLDEDTGDVYELS